MNKWPCILAVLVFTFSCLQNNTENLPDALKQIAGTWQLDDSNTFEIWENKGTFYAGRVIKIKNQDTLLVESLRILSLRNEIYFEATVPRQNQGEPILFKLTEAGTSHFQFENPDHDFPKKITYSFPHRNKLIAAISGNNKQAKLNYQKIK